MVFNILTRVGDNASIPCLATDPSLDNLRLEACSGGAPASGLRSSPSLERGIVIHNTQKAFEGCYVCTGRLGRERVQSHRYYLTVRPGESAHQSGTGFNCVQETRSIIAIHSFLF